jgi:O-acetyl-ADP-ribose deacetylase (regulator of RNase III)
VSTITYLKGDATAPQAAGNRILAHVVNDKGTWGKGFVLAVSNRWPATKEQFHEWHQGRDASGFALGAVQFVEVEPGMWVANMVGQHDVKPTEAGPPIRYDAVRRCLEQVAAKAREWGATVHMPRIGCGLAGGTWEEIEPILRETLCAAGVSVFVYDVP